MRALMLLALFGLVAGCGKSDAPVAVVAGDKTTAPEVKAPAKEESTLPAWLKELAKPLPDKQILAINAILEIAKLGDDVVPPLIDTLKDRKNAGAGVAFANKPNSTREAVVMCLLKLGPKGEVAAVEKALPILRQALTDPDSDVREHAAWAIARLGAKAKPAQKDLLKLLVDEARTTRYAGYQALQASGFDQTPDIVALLKNKDAGVRGDAAEAIGSGWLPKPGEAALPTLIEALKDEDSFVAKTAAEAIGELGPKAAIAIPALIEILKSATPEQFQNAQLSDLAAMVALRRIGAPAVPDLVKVLADKNFLARFQAALALGLIGPAAKDALEPLTKLMTEEQESADVALEAAVARFQVGGEPKESLDFIAGLLRREDVPLIVRGRAVVALARFGPKGEPAVEDLVKLMKSDQEVMRKAVIFALKNMGSGAKPAVPALGVALSDEELTLRLAAAEILKGLGIAAKPAIPDLTKALSDSDDTVRRLAAETLGAFGPDAKAAVPELAKVIVNKEYKQADRVAAADALAAMGKDAKPAVPALSEALTLRDPLLTLAAAKAIGRVGPGAKDAVPNLIQRAQKGYTGERNAAMLALGLIGPEAKEAVEPLKTTFTKSTGEQRIWAAAALTKITPADAKLYVPVIVEAVADKSTKASAVVVRNAAIDALELIGPLGKDATNDLVGLLRDAKPEIRVQAIRGLAFITSDGKATVSPILRMLNDKELKVRQAAVRALGQIGPNAKEALPRLKEMAASGTPLSDEARAAVDRIEKK